MTLITFEQAVAASHGNGKAHALLGNGFSIACKSDIFSYSSLFEQADFRSLSHQVHQAFETLGTTDFEIVMRALQNAAQLLLVYSENAALSEQMIQDAAGLREVLVRAVAGNHPAHPAEIDEAAYQHCRRFLSNFSSVYTLNYDLLLYWAYMHEPPFEEEFKLPMDDGFRTPADGATEYVTWDIENTNNQIVHYLHGALHLFDSGPELKKFTWINTGIRLIEQISNALEANTYPLFVAEGESAEKITRIKHSGYLSRSLRSFSSIGGSLFIFGHSFAENDMHVLNLIKKNKVSKLFVSIYGDHTTPVNRAIMERARALAEARPTRRPLSVEFYSAESARVWG